MVRSLFTSTVAKKPFELILRTTFSGNQFSIYGAVAELCKELSKDSEVAGKPAANEDLESTEIPSELPVADAPHTPRRSCRETCCKTVSTNSNNFLKIENCPNCAPTSLKIVEKGKFFITLDEEEGPDEMKNLCRE